MKYRRNPDPVGDPNIRNLEGVVDRRILDAMRAASAQLTKLGIRHALVGGLAIGAYGHVRATKDVDFLVGDEGFDHYSGGLISTVKGFPSRVTDIQVDALSAMPEEKHLERAVGRAVMSGGIPIAPIEILVYLKLKSPRPKDALDILELLMIGIESAPILAYLRENAPGLVEKFKQLVQRSKS